MNAMTIEIFHNTTEDAKGRWVGLFGYQPEHQVSKAFAFSWAVPEVTDIHLLAEHAFRVGNGADELSSVYYSLAGRSMSVGDLVRLNGRVWLSCDPAGFSLLTHWPSIIGERPAEHDLATAKDLVQPGRLPGPRDRQVATGWPAVDRYRQDMDRLRQQIVRTAAGEITALLPELNARQAAARLESQSATRAVEAMFQKALIDRRQHAINTQRARVFATAPRARRGQSGERSR